MAARAFPRPLCFALLLLAAVAADAEQDSRDPFPLLDRRYEQNLAALEAGQTWVLRRADAARLAGMNDDLRVVFVETKGAEIAMRLTPLDRSGADLGVGRVILVAPSERREIPLRSLFDETQLEGVQLRVESLRGDGRVTVKASASNGADFELVPEQDEHSRPRPAHLKSTTDLIDDAVASGRINEETAILYRVYLLFGDTRLPQEYRGVDRDVKDSLYLIDVRERFDTLSPAIQELLLPFLTPPAYPGSWAEPGATVKMIQAPPTCQAFSGKWKFVDSPSGVVRVWYRDLLTGDALRASAIGSEVDTKIWPKFLGLMQRRPLSDQAEDCNGGNPNLDIYLTDLSGAEGEFVPYRLTSRFSGQPFPGFILLRRTASNPAVAHEVFHAFQMAFTTAGIKTSQNYRWWTEGSATWSMDFVYSGENDEQTFVGPLLEKPDVPLDLEDGFLTCNRCYATYLLPFFVHRWKGSEDFVRVAWEKCANQPALEAVDQAIPGGFKDVWPQFALRNWNLDPPIKDYRQWDRLFRGVYGLTRPQEVSLNGRDAAIPIPVNLPRVSAMYKHFKFTDDNVRSVAFWNGLTYQLSQPDDYEIEAASDAQKKGSHIWALVKIRGKDWQTEDWTDEGAVTFCRDTTDERIDELVLIISNSEFSDRNRKLQHGGLTPLLWVSNMACWRWKGTTSFTETTDTGVIKVNANATFTRMGGRGATPFVYYDVTGALTWSWTGICNGSGALAIVPGAVGGGAFLQTFNYTPPGGTHHRAYIAIGSGDGRIVATIPCNTNPPSTATVFFPAWLANDRFEPPFYKVNPIGWIFADSFVTAGQGSFVWNFTAERE